MKKRMSEFKKELRESGDLELNFEQLTIWFQQWAQYISFGGVRPDRPH